MPPGKIRKTNGKNYLQKLNRTQLYLNINIDEISLDLKIFISILYFNYFNFVVCMNDSGLKEVSNN